MATEVAPESTVETTDQDTQDQQQQATSETEGNGEAQQVSTPEKPIVLPDDHPLVKTLAANKTKLSTQASELAELRSKSAKVTQLEADLNARPSQEALDTLQVRYDRLEGFLQAIGGPVAQALDSRSFTTALFESDKDIADIVKDWQRANPSATSKALGSAPAEPGKGKVDPNVLLRIAAGRG